MVEGAEEIVRRSRKALIGPIAEDRRPIERNPIDCRSTTFALQRAGRFPFTQIKRAILNFFLIYFLTTNFLVSKSFFT